MRLGRVVERVEEDLRRHACRLSTQGEHRKLSTKTLAETSQYRSTSATIALLHRLMIAE
jgi:hypothetical protein